LGGGVENSERASSKISLKRSGKEAFPRCFGEKESPWVQGNGCDSGDIIEEKEKK
jgi:hypothetical protein